MIRELMTSTGGEGARVAADSVAPTSPTGLAYRERLERIMDRIFYRALHLQRSGLTYPEHWQHRFKKLHDAWCDTYGHRVQS